jgi:hypothetical protein
MALESGVDDHKREGVVLADSLQKQEEGRDTRGGSATAGLAAVAGGSKAAPIAAALAAPDLDLIKQVEQEPRNRRGLSGSARAAHPQRRDQEVAGDQLEPLVLARLV